MTNRLVRTFPARACFFRLRRARQGGRARRTRQGGRTRRARRLPRGSPHPSPDPAEGRFQQFSHVKAKKVRFTWKTIPRMGPTNSIPDSKQIGLQKNRVWRHGFSLGRSVEADAAASHPPSFGGLSPPRTTPCPQTHRVCGLRSCPPSSSLPPSV